MEEVNSLKNIIRRERRARKAAESLMEIKTLELYKAKEDALRLAQTKSDFLSNMSHEIRTPLNAIVGFASLLASESGELSESFQEYISSIHFAAGNLIEIVNEILDFSKIESGKVVFEAIEFSPREVVREICKTYELKAREKNLVLSYQISDSVPRILLGDKTKLSQVLTNLIGNAIKFTESGGIKVLLNMEEREADMSPLFHFQVKDTGIGIGEEKLNSIFESFTQANVSTTRKFGGTGLGLTITKRLIELQNGKIWVESELGKGTTFNFCIPYQVALGSKLVKDDTPNPSDRDLEKLSKIRVLVAEDTVMNQVLMRKILKKKNIPFEIVKNGQLAIEQLQNGEFDLVLMDLHMPVMDGKEATAAIRSGEAKVKNPHIPILGLTADAFAGTKREVLALGMNDFLTKPINVEVLYTAILEWGEKEEENKKET